MKFRKPWHIWRLVDGEWQSIAKGSVRFGRTMRRAVGIARHTSTPIAIAHERSDTDECLPDLTNMFSARIKNPTLALEAQQERNRAQLTPTKPPRRKKQPATDGPVPDEVIDAYREQLAERFS